MEFQWPANLSFLAVVAALLIVYVIAQRRRQRYALRYASLLMIKEAVGRGPGIRRHIPPILFMLGFAVLVVALARPSALVKVPALEGTVILAMDVSGSMLADDVKPNRIEAAKAAARTFVERQRQAKGNVRVGIVSFSDNAQIVLAPTLDYTAINSAIDRLKTEKATAIGRAIVVSIDAIFEGADVGTNEGDDITGASATTAPGRTPRPAQTPIPQGQFAAATIVLMTDGENNINPPPLEVIPQAVSRGIRVYTVGVGTPEGAIVTNQGRTARSELDEKTLIQIAEMSSAKYYNAQTEGDLRQVYEELAAELVLRDERSEVTVMFAAVAAALLLLAGCFALLWFSRLP